jgi:hypothetical protein
MAFGFVLLKKSIQVKKYYFRVQAQDYTGNVQEFPKTADTSTLIEYLVQNYLPFMFR